MRYAPPGQHPPDSLRDAGPAGERGRLTKVAASAKDAATVLSLCCCPKEATAPDASLTLWTVLTLR